MSMLAAATRLRALDLRDRWGYKLDDDKLLELAHYINGRPDVDADQLGLAMLALGEVPLVCEGYDTPAGDDLLEDIIKAATKEKE